MRSIKVTPDSELEYHKVRAGFTVDIRSQINKLDRISIKQLMLSPAIFAENKIIHTRTIHRSLSSGVVCHIAKRFSMTRGACDLAAISPADEIAFVVILDRPSKVSRDAIVSLHPARTRV